MELMLFMTICHTVAIVLYQLCKLITKNKIPVRLKKWYLRLSLIFIWLPLPYIISEFLPGIQFPFKLNLLGRFNVKDMDGTLFWSSGIKYAYIFIGVIVVTLLGYLYYISKYRSLRHYFLRDIREQDKKLPEEVGVFEREVRVSNRVDTPAVFGIKDPIILMPDDSLGINETRLAVRHEILHIRQNDLWWNVIAIFSAGFHWFNPIVYLTMDELRRVNEIYIDELVIENLDDEDKRAYADAILYYSMEEYYRDSYRTALSNSGKEVRKRISLMYEDHGPKISKKIAVALMVIGLGVSCLPAFAYEDTTDIIFTANDIDKEFFVEKVSEAPSQFSAGTFDIPEFDINDLGEYSLLWCSNDDKIPLNDEMLVDNNCNHIFEYGKIVKHVLENDKCITGLYEGTRCKECNMVVMGESINEVVYNPCFHKK